MYSSYWLLKTSLVLLSSLAFENRHLSVWSGQTLVSPCPWCRGPVSDFTRLAPELSRIHCLPNEPHQQSTLHYHRWLVVGSRGNISFINIHQLFFFSSIVFPALTINFLPVHLVNSSLQMFQSLSLSLPFYHYRSKGALSGFCLLISLFLQHTLEIAKLERETFFLALCFVSFPTRT